MRKAEERRFSKGAGDFWTWTALDADLKLIIGCLCGGRDAGYAYEFMQDVASPIGEDASS